jgi:peptidoglycan hydrolase-like protein with peptidoglycan-binding domain
VPSRLLAAKYQMGGVMGHVPSRAEENTPRHRRHWKRVARRYQRYLAEGNWSAENWVGYGHALRKSGELGFATHAYAMALSLEADSSSDIHLQAGHLHEVQGDTQKAVRFYKSALKLNPESLDAANGLRFLGVSNEEVTSIIEGGEEDRRNIGLHPADRVLAATFRNDPPIMRRKWRSVLAAVIVVLCLAGGATLLVGRPFEIAEDAYRSALAEVQRLTGMENVEAEAAARKAAEEKAWVRAAARKVALEKALAVPPKSTEEQALTEAAARKSAEEKASMEAAARKSAEERASMEAAARRSAEEKASMEAAARRSAEEKASMEAVARRSAEEKASMEAAARESAEEKASMEAAARRAAEQKLAAEDARFKAEEEARTAAERKPKLVAESRDQAERAEAALALSARDREKVQVTLNSFGHEIPTVTGHFGPRTRAMITAWQKKKGLPETGYLDASQLAALREQTAQAMRADEVKLDARQQPERVEAALNLSEQDRKGVQVALNSLGHEMPTVTGYFGPRTRAMITAWQKAQGLPETGYLTEAQLAALRQQAAAALAKYDQAQTKPKAN